MAESDYADNDRFIVITVNGDDVMAIVVVTVMVMVKAALSNNWRL